MSVPIPNGVAPGQQFQVQYQPAAQPMQAMAVAQPKQAAVPVPVVMGTAAMVPPQPQQMQMQPAGSLAGPQPMQPASHLGHHPPPGAPFGGHWKYEKYCGTMTWIVVCCICPAYALCACCVPLDTRMVYEVHDGTGMRKFDQLGKEIFESSGDGDSPPRHDEGGGGG